MSDAETIAALTQEVEKCRRLLKEQEHGAQMLIRRDLELSKANERLRALDQMKTDFVSVATHQLRTPLSAIKWLLSMLLKGDMGSLNDQQRTFIMKAYESNNRMITLLGDMLLSDQIDSGKLKSVPIPTALPDLIDNLLLEMRPIATRRDITIDFSPPAEAVVPPVNIDPQHMRAILQNLIENAIKYSKVGGMVRVSVEKAGEGMVGITVADQGIGIPADQQQQVFTRFFRAPNAIKMETDGSGLGLFIVKNITEHNGGTISFTSAEDQGTTFRIEFPHTA
ncbi:HAMP domain-containing histidine kinase [Candidatus Kaiserbacteria bacterium]|nr:HAMP domain-containing histidine kinase [Candidatus Kaiserbacteria bacterium]